MQRVNPFADARIAETYEAWYAASADAARAEATTLLRALRRDFPGATRLVEIGCGTGHFARIFAAQDYRVVGVDASAAMLEQARRLASPPCAQADALALPFADQTFDVALFITTLEFLREPARALVEARRVTTRGVVLGVLNAWSALGVRRRWQARRAESAADPASSAWVYRAARFYSPYALARLTRAALGGDVRVRWETILGRGALGAFIVLTARWEGARR